MNRESNMASAIVLPPLVDPRRCGSGFTATLHFTDLNQSIHLPASFDLDPLLN